MRAYKKIISMIMIFSLLIGIAYSCPVEAKKVESKRKTSYKHLKIVVLNEDKQYRMNEMAFSVKNKTKKKVKVTRVYLQFYNEGKWKTLQRKRKTVEKRNTVIGSKDIVYDNFNIFNDYVGPIYERFPGGTYSVCINYKYNGKRYFTRKKYHLNGPNPDEMETIPGYYGDEKTTLIPSGMDGAQDSTDKVVAETDKTVAVKKAKAKIIKTDFFIRKKGKATAMVFAEASYDKTKKVKITAHIQRKVKGKWKNYKRYKITKKSNIAFINKQVKLKKKGKYRMRVKVVVFCSKKRKTYKVKSKIQKY